MKFIPLIVQTLLTVLRLVKIAPPKKAPHVDRLD